MHSPAPEPDRSPMGNPAGGQSAPAPGPALHDAICARVLPPRIRIPFLVIEFECGSTHYRTRLVDLVAEAVEGECGRQNAECGTLPVRNAECGVRNEGSREPASPLSLSPSALLLPASATPHSALRTPHSLYSLRKGLGVWHLVFEGREAVLRPERGLLYVAWLLQHPPVEPLHAIDLVAQIPALYRAQLGLTALVDPATGHAVPLARHARLQERSLALDDAQSVRAVLRRERELEALLEDEAATEPEKAEALAELEALAEFQRRRARRSKDGAQRAAATLRQSLRRLHTRLAEALDSQGAPHPVLRPFAEHLRRYLLLPSSRSADLGGRFSQARPPGRFTYEPPPGVRWEA